MLKPLLLALSIVALASADTPVGFATRYIRLGQQDSSHAIAADAQGNIFILSTLSPNALQRLTKTDSQGNVTGSFDFDAPGAAGVAVDRDGNLLVLGSTPGTAIDGPGSARGSTACIYRIDAALTKIAASRCLSSGATGGSMALAAAVDSANNIYVTGTTFDPKFPVTPGAYQTDPPTGDYRSGPSLTATYMFVTKFTPDLGTIVYSTYFGDSRLGCDRGVCFLHYATTAPVGIAVDGAGDVIIAGNTDSPNIADPSALGGGSFAPTYGFVTKFSADGSALDGFWAMPFYGTWSTRGVIGTAQGLAVDRDGGVLICGTGGGDFGPNAIQSTIAAGYSSFVVKFDAALKNILWGTLLGDASAASPRGLALDADGNLWLTAVQ